MANHKSAKKRVLVSKKKNAINTARKSAVKTFIKKVLKAIDSGDKSSAVATFRETESKIMKSAGKVMPKKRASRKVSKLSKKLNSLEA